MKLGKIVQDARREKKLKVEDVSDKTNLSVGTIRAVEQGRRMPSSQAMERLDDYLRLGGHWIDSFTYADFEGEVHFLNESDGTIRRKNRFTEAVDDITSSADENDLRIRLIRKLLTADVDTLKAIDLLVK